MFLSASSTRLILTALLLSFAGSAFSQQVAPVGNWSGTLSLDGQDNQKSIGVQASFSATQVSVHFTQPIACRINASFVKTTSDGSRYDLQPSTNGGAFCTKLFPGVVYAFASDNSINFSVHSDSSTWIGTLTH